MTDDLNTETLLKAGQRIAALSADRFAVVPSDCRLEYLDVKKLESLEPRPRRIRGNVEVHHVDQFLTYLHEFNTGVVKNRIFAELTTGVFTAILNFHSPTTAEADWCDHRCVLKLQNSVEWKAWVEMNRKAMSQEQFARFIETNLQDIYKPDHADILEISRTLEATKTVMFDSKVKLENSTRQFTFKEDVNATARGNLEIPDAIQLFIPVFNNTGSKIINCRFRYAIKDEKLTLWYEIVRPEKIVEAEVRDVAAKIAEKFPVIDGSYTPAP